MLQYVNCFSCIASKKKDSIVIHFDQNEPLASPETKGADVPEYTHKIASLIMDRDCAEALVDVLGKMLSGSLPPSNEE